jgi:sec-independent protein translocase protein TatB
MFSLGFGEILIICVILIVVVGPERLPSLMKGVGKTMRTVREASRDLRGAIGIDEMMREDVLRPMPQPRKPPPATVNRDAPPASSQPAADASAAGADASTNGSPANANANAGAPDASAGAAQPRAVPPSTVVPGSTRSPFPKPAALQGGAASAASVPPRPSAPPAISAPPPAGAAGSAQPDSPAPPSTDAPTERKP